MVSGGSVFHEKPLKVENLAHGRSTCSDINTAPGGRFAEMSPELRTPSVLAHDEYQIKLSFFFWLYMCLRLSMLRYQQRSQDLINLGFHVMISPCVFLYSCFSPTLTSLLI